MEVSYLPNIKTNVKDMQTTMRNIDSSFYTNGD